MKRLAAAGLAALLVNIVAASEAATPSTPIQPGLWKYSVRLGGLVPVDDGRECIREDQIERFIAFPGNKHYKCSYPTKTVANGKIAMVGQCTDKRGRTAPIRARGVYSPESFRLNINLTTINGIPLAGVMSAQRVSASCPAS